MKAIRAFFRHSKVSVRYINGFEKRNFCYTGRFYLGYVGLYACITRKKNGYGKNLYISILLFSPTKECKEMMIKQKTY